MREVSSSSYASLPVDRDDLGVRYAILAMTVLALLAAGTAYEWRGPSSSTSVPAIELRPLQADERRPTTAPKAAQKREERSEVSGGTTPAPAEVLARAREHEDDDDSWDDDGDAGGEDD